VAIRFSVRKKRIGGVPLGEGGIAPDPGEAANRKEPIPLSGSGSFRRGRFRWFPGLASGISSTIFLRRSEYKGRKDETLIVPDSEKREMVFGQEGPGLL